ncbi:transposase InsO family protein [Stakelama sediminis]|uniref:Transposase InsO family protein n=1 Tax=Stakelama sediminis TaxID=463200 RepID=A0A840Z3A5_9SPHN|nr:transposase InsO family protein [Stakelama sediminis]
MVIAICQPAFPWKGRSGAWEPHQRSSGEIIYEDETDDAAAQCGGVRCVQHANDLLFREPRSLHLSVLLVGPDSNQAWRKIRGSRHDRGSQYCSYDYQKKLQAHSLRPSMSGKGNCYDNSAVETFFKSLKAELIWRQSWPTRRQAEAAIFQYINGFYNSRRRHSYLGGISPVAFEAKVA